ncbi:MAG: hypothetical protein J5I65_03555 [Aridibacter famidurans]|nr:hypothetical protein [Aridibacter famidurans]
MGILTRVLTLVGGWVGTVPIFSIPTIIAALFLSVSVLGQSTAVEKCKVEGKTGKYKLISEAWSGTVSKDDPTDDVLMVFIQLEPERFNTEELRRVAARINRVYCKTIRVQAVFFEDIDSFSKYFSPDYLLRPNECVRGFYSFDREERSAKLEFSTKLGNPTTETQMDIEIAPFGARTGTSPVPTNLFLLELRRP